MIVPPRMMTTSKQDYLKAIFEAENEGETVISATLGTPNYRKIEAGRTGDAALGRICQGT